MAILPTVSDLRLFTTIRKMMPIIAASGASVTGLKKLSHELAEAFTSSSRMI